MTELIITLTIFVLTTIFVVVVALLNNIPIWFLLLSLILMWVAYFTIGDE